MATQVFLLDTPATTHRGTNTNRIDGTASGWQPRGTNTSRGSSLGTSAATPTVTGPTAGVELGPLSGSGKVEWITPPVDADITISGTITGNIWASENNMSANVAINFYVDKVSAVDGSLTRIVTSARVVEVAVTTRAVNNFTATPGAGVALNKGDRLRIVIFGDDVGTMAGTFTFDASFGGPTAAADGDTYITFNETFGFQTETTISQEVNSTSGAIGQDTTFNMQAQSFQVAADGPLTNIQILTGPNTGTPTDDVIFSIQADSSNVPSGTALVSGTLTSANWTASAWNTVPIAGLALTASTTYWLVAQRSGSLDASNFRTWRYTGTDPYANGRRANHSGSWSTGTASDYTFRISTLSGSGGSTLYLTDTTDAYLAQEVMTPPTDLEFGSSTNFQKTAQSFLAPSNVTLSKVDIWLAANTGTPTDDLTLEVQTDSGSTSPSGTVVGSSSTVTSANLTASTWNSFTPSASLSAGVTYWIVAYRTGAVSGSNYRTWRSAGNVYTDGRRATWNGSTWATSNLSDMTFRLNPGSATSNPPSTSDTDREAWTSRGGSVQTDVTNTTAGWTTPVQVTDVAAGNAVSWFTRPLQSFTLSGLVKVNCRVLESAATANASVGCQIARVDGDGTNATVWGYANRDAATTSGSAGEVATTETAYTVYVSGDDLAITDGQRLRIRLFHDDCADVPLVTGNSLTSYYGGPTAGASGDTYLIFGQTLTELATGVAFPPPREDKTLPLRDTDPWSTTGWRQ